MMAISIQVLISLLILSLSAYSHADTFATTDDGKRIKLNANGTWQYLEERKSSVGDLSYSDDFVMVLFKKCRIYKDTLHKILYTEIQLSVTVVSKTKIIDSNIYTSLDNYNRSSRFKLKDSFGNNIRIYSVSAPNHVGTPSLRPGQTTIFHLYAMGSPVKLSTHLVLEIDRSFLGTKLPLIFKIPNDKIESNK